MQVKWVPCRITVLMRLRHDELIERFILEDKRECYDFCDLYYEGQTFTLTSPDKPDGFCSWAWADIHKEVVAIMASAQFPNSKESSSVITCCTDGLRPVIFRVERVMY